LSTNPSKSELEALEMGNIVYLDGVVYTAREGVYMKVLEEGTRLPLDLPGESAAIAPTQAQAGNHFGAFIGGAIIGGFIGAAVQPRYYAPAYRPCYTSWETRYNAYGQPYNVNVQYC
ncbi:unnamed protein product, partial [marine sediment metagenome]